MAKVAKLHVDFEAGTAKFVENTRRARKSLGDFGKTAKGTKGELARMPPIIGRLIGPLTGLVSVGATLSSVFGNLRLKEKLDAQLKTATGSAEGAELAFASLARTARKMPNQLQEITQEFIRLKNLGLDASERSIISYGNTASAMGKSLNQMIEAVADATTFEFERLKEFGIKAKQNRDTVAFTFRGTTTEVRKSAEDIENYLRNLGEVQFAGSMAEQMDTIDGKLSQLSDAWFQFSQRVKGSDLSKSFIDGLTGALNAVTDESVYREFREKIFDKDQGLSFVKEGEIHLLERFLADSEARIKRLNEMTLVPGTGGRRDRNIEKINENAAKVQARLDELKAERDLRIATEERTATQERALEGQQKMADWMEKWAHKQKGILRTYGADHKKLSSQILDLQVKINEGAAGNTEAAMKQFEALHKQREELTEAYLKAKEAQDRANKSLVRYESEWKSMRRSMKQAFAEGVAGGEKLKDVLEDVVRVWARSLIFNTLLGKQDSATGVRSGGLLDVIFGGGGNGGVLGALGGLIPGRASGGSVAAGQMYRVNEGAGQMEYFRPNVGGQVMPLGAGVGGGSGVSITMNVDARGAGPREIDELKAVLPGMVKRMIVPVVRNAQVRGMM